MIFKGVRDGKPYPEHGLSLSAVGADPAPADPPRRVGDHHDGAGAGPAAVGGLDVLRRPVPARGAWQGIVYLEDGLHRAVRAALRNRTVLHARVFDMDMPSPAAAWAQSQQI